MSDNFERLKQLLSGGATPDECLFCDGDDDDLVIIGGTRQQTFNLPFNYDLIKKLMIVYVQDDKIIIKKTLNNITKSAFDESLIYFTLNEEDTFKFKVGKILSQMKVLLEDGSILVSDIFHIKAVRTIDNEYFSSDGANLCALEADVRSNIIKLTELHDLYTGSDDYYTCKFDFDSTWEKFYKIALFRDSYNNVVAKYLDKDECLIPSMITRYPGLIYVGVIGQGDLNSTGGKTIIKSTGWSNSVRVDLGCNTLKQSSVIIDFPQATDVTPGIMKLYQCFGENIDGPISQKVVTDGLRTIRFNVANDDDKCLVLDSMFIDN